LLRLGFRSVFPTDMPPIRAYRSAALFCLLLFSHCTVAATLPSVIDEASGLTRSLQHPGVYWTHNDNINLPASSKQGAPLLFAINTDGRLLSTLKLDGVRQRDWEAISHLDLNGHPTLVIGDIGDNRNYWPDYRLWFVPEPASLTPKATIRPTALIRFRYPDQVRAPRHQGGFSGGHDAESLTFDVRHQEFLILTKREKPARLFAVPLDALVPLSDATTSIATQNRHTPVVTARFITNLPTLPAPNLVSWLLHPFTSPYADQPTDIALSPDGRLMAILTYGAVYYFRRKADEDWNEALKAPVDAESLPSIEQWEGASFSPDGRNLIVVREGRGDNTILVLPVPETTR
jgi:hypothetical protein